MFFWAVNGSLSHVPVCVRWHDYRKGKRGPGTRPPFEALTGDRLACLAPLLNIAFPLTLGSASDIGIPLVVLLLSFLASDSVSFLDFADQLIGLTVDDVEVVIRQFSPTLLYRSLHLFPFAF